MRVVPGRIYHRDVGQKLLEEIYRRDYDKGAKQVVILGAKGAGKTTLLMRLALRSLELGDLVIWRGRFRDVWTRLKPQDVVLYFHELDEPRILRFKPGSDEGEDVTSDYKIRKYQDARELLQILDRTKINVIYEPTYFIPSDDFRGRMGLNGDIIEGIGWWYEFLEAVTTRPSAIWTTICFDEIHDLAPSGTSGPLWKLIEKGQNFFSELRDRYVSFYGVTHNLDLIDFRIQRKFSWFIYLRGARPVKGTAMKEKHVVNWLQEGEGIIESLDEGAYGKISFDPLPRKRYIFLIERTWKGPVPRPKETGERRKSIKSEVFEIAEQHGVEKALEYLKELYEQGSISEQYYHKLKRDLKASLLL